MNISSIDSIIYFPKSLNTWKTIFLYRDEGHIQFKVDQSNLPAGTVMAISFHERLGPDQEFLEFEHVSIAVPIKIPPPPAQGYLPIVTYEFKILFGLQIQARIVQGSLPEKGLFCVLNKIH